MASAFGTEFLKKDEEDNVDSVVTTKKPSKVVVEASELDAASKKFENLRNAVRVLYYCAFWTPDRPVDEAKVWEDVRDACGFPQGNSPTPRPFDGVRADYSVEKLRLLGRLVRKEKGIGEFSSDQARAFLSLHGDELRDRIDAAVRAFLKEKL